MQTTIFHNNSETIFIPVCYKEMISREFDNETQIVFIRYSGTIELKDILENIRVSFSKHNLPRNLKILEDGRKAVYNLTVEDNEKIRKLISEYIDNFNFIKLAFVQNRPFETALNLEYEYSMPFPNYYYKVFSLMENAINWLKYD